MDTSSLDDRRLAFASFAAFGLQLTLCGLTLASGVSQQHFEWVDAPDAYATTLVRDATWLRTIIALDDVFIAAYTATTVLLATRLARLRWEPMHALIVVFGVVAGGLDLAENHDLLAMLRWAELQRAIPAEHILARSDLSQLKWLLGHVAFVGVGIVLPPDPRPVARLVRLSLLVGQLAIGAATWCVTGPAWTAVAVWSRYATFLAGFALIPWLVRSSPARRDDVAAATGARP